MSLNTPWDESILVENTNLFSVAANDQDLVEQTRTPMPDFQVSPDAGLRRPLTWLGPGLTAILEDPVRLHLTATTQTCLWQAHRDGLQRVAKSRSNLGAGVARHIVRPIAFERLLLKVQRSVASQNSEWQVSATAVIRLQNLTGWSQPQATGGFFSTACSQRLFNSKPFRSPRPGARVH